MYKPIGVLLLASTIGAFVLGDKFAVQAFTASSLLPRHA
jgi:hypothetical protein